MALDKIIIDSIEKACKEKGQQELQKPLISLIQRRADNEIDAAEVESLLPRIHRKIQTDR